MLKYGDSVKEIKGFASDTTNNIMELTAVIEALKSLDFLCVATHMMTPTAELADLEDYKTFYPSLPLEWTDQILKQFFSKIKGIFKSRIGNKDLIKRSFELANDLETYNDPKGIYLKCLDCLIY